MTQFITSTQAAERLAAIQDLRYNTPKFNRSCTPPPDRSTIDLIEMCDTLKYMALTRPHYLPSDVAEVHAKLATLIYLMKHSFDRRMEEEEKLNQQTNKRAHCVTKITKFPMGHSGKVREPSGDDYTEAELLAELERRGITV